MRPTRPSLSCILLVLAASAAQSANAERWIQASPVDSRVWYDADDIRLTSGGLVGVWVYTGPSRTNTEADGMKHYPSYSIIDCK